MQEEQEDEEKQKLHLNKDVLHSILLNEEVANKPVVVISVAGAFRTGKSFLLNCMTRYLTAPHKSRWLDNKIKSFEWKSGCDAHTDGIWISPPIPVTLESGEEAALLLMDTQGIFDEDSSIADSTRIFALSTLLSSVQVFNVMNNLKSDDLDHLQLFAEFGRLATDTMSQKPFQDLVFLVRDWCHTQNHELGAKGGKELVDKRLGNKRGKLAHRAEGIKECFSSISGFLLPHPGEDATVQEFEGDKEQMRPNFISALNELMPLLFSEENLKVKLSGGSRMTCKDLATLIEKSVEIFQGDKLPSPISVVQALAEAGNRAAVDSAFQAYQEHMMDFLQGPTLQLNEERLLQEHNDARENALEALKQQKIIRDSAKPENYYSELLDKKINQQFQMIRLVAQAMWLKQSQREKQARLIKIAAVVCAMAMIASRFI